MSLGNPKSILKRIFVINLLIIAAAMAAMSQTSAFTYQGSLLDNGLPANGTYNMTFKVFDALAAGGQQGSTITNTTVNVANGIFTVQLDFTTSPFVAGADRWLEIAVKKPADLSYTTLAPRQQITSNPYTIRTINAGSADSLSAACTGCVDGVKIASGAITDAKVSATASIGYSKLNLTNSIQNSDITANAITTSKVANGTVTNSKLADQAVDSLKILDGSIVDADINAAAAIAGSKISGNIAGNAANVTGTVALANGGTGATTAANARTNLGLGTLATQSPTGTANATTYLRGDNTWAAVAGGVGAPLFTSLTSQMTVTSTNPTYTDVLSINLEANKTYMIRMVGIGQRVAATSGTGTFRLSYSGNLNTDMVVSFGNSVFGPFTVSNTTFMDQESTGNANNFTSTPGIKLDVEGYFRTTSAGTLKIQLARTTTNVTTDLIVREGTFILATPLN